MDILTYDEALLRSGGFGLYQILLIISCAIVSNHGSQVSFNFVYLTAAMKYECVMDDGSWRACQKDDICDQGLKLDETYRFDQSDQNYVYGFYSKLEMTCWDNKDIAFMG